jgi:cobyrinic acid a,c-diamide synthase
MTTIAIPRLLIGGTASGVGKTTFVVGLIRTLRSRGLKVAAFKCGPDYLDPTYHTRASGLVSHNLDGWMMGREGVFGTFTRVSADADIAIIEGVMGLYDGASSRGDEGSSAEIAKWLKAPVLLVVDASGMARTVAAIASGFQTFDPEICLAGVICNRIGSQSHLQLLRDALDVPPVMGGMPKNTSAVFPERHLGLRTAEEGAVPEALMQSWGEIVRDWCDVDSIISLAQGAPPLSTSPSGQAAPTTMRCKIGLAFDEAFHFYYEDNLRRLENAGAELVRFSPVHDEHLPPIDGIYIGGGYPEVHAQQLAANLSMRHEIRSFVRASGAIYAECGGLMYLCSSLRTLDGSRYEMCGILPGETTMRDKLQALGYVEVETVKDSLVGPAGLRFRGHQFRYSNIEISETVTRTFDVSRRRGGASFLEGYQIANVIGSYVHAHWASNPGIPLALVDAFSRPKDRAASSSLGFWGSK